MVMSTTKVHMFYAKSCKLPACQNILQTQFGRTVASWTARGAISTQEKLSYLAKEIFT